MYACVCLGARARVCAWGVCKINFVFYDNIGGKSSMVTRLLHI